MFKHEILSDFGDFSGLSPDRKNYMQWLKKMLLESTEIFAGKGAAYDDICVGKTAGHAYKNLIAPFNKALVSYVSESSKIKGGQVKSTKRANLIVYSKDSTYLYNFNFFDEVKKWVLFPICPVIPMSTHSNDVDCIDLFGLSGLITKSLGDELFNEVVTTSSILEVLLCKNVNLSPVDPPEKLNKKRIKNGKYPLYRYHVLTVDLDKGRKQSGVGRGANLGTMPVHLCRGHFKEYTKEKPLFGRITGRFWWQPCARGKAENGVVMKDYELKHNNV